MNDVPVGALVAMGVLFELDAARVRARVLSIDGVPTGKDEMWTDVGDIDEEVETDGVFVQSVVSAFRPVELAQSNSPRRLHATAQGDRAGDAEVAVVGGGGDDDDDRGRHRDGHVEHVDDVR